MNKKLRLPKFKMGTLLRIRLWYGALFLVMAIFLVRMFYLQIIKHDQYKQAALANQLKQYEIPAERGGIFAYSGGDLVPVVLNEVRYTIFADPKFIENIPYTASQVQNILGGKQAEYEELISTEGSRYVVLAKKINKNTNQKILDKKLKGIGSQPVNYRTYPQGRLAAQLLGFVNDEGQGTYGIEQALDETLRGKPGRLKAITDINGVPLAANQENLTINPEPGQDIVLTVDLGMQSQLEDILKQGLKNAVSKSGSALVIDVETGEIKAMANYPSYDPSKFSQVEDASLFTNPSVSSPLEIGSIMKPFTTAAALDTGAVNKSSTYYDPNFYEIDGFKITNIEETGGPGNRSVPDILQLSLNTGATWLLMQMGGGEINQKARVTWFDYMVNHYRFGKLTGIEQGYEAEGNIPHPNRGFGLDLQYANTSFGQGMTATPLQVGAALSGVVNGGTYYKPRLVEAFLNEDGSIQEQEPVVVTNNAIKSEVSNDIVELMENVINKNYLVYKINQPTSAFTVGGKTGTAQIPNPQGGYFENKFNGMFMGFVGGEKPQYAIVVRVDEPLIPGYAGSQAAAPIFGMLSEMLINNFGIEPAG